MGLILDSSVVIAYERAGVPASEVLQAVNRAVSVSEPCMISVISVMELEHGIWRALTVQHQERRRRFVDDFLRHVVSVDVDPAVARIAGRIDAETRRVGTPLSAADLLIGATALHLGFTVVTLNLRHLERIPGLRVISI